MRNPVVGLALIVGLITGCATEGVARASPTVSGIARLPGSSTVRWNGGASVALSDLKLERLTANPQATLVVRVERMTTSNVQGHNAGFVYQLSGSQRLFVGDRTVTLHSGDATFVAPPEIPHRHEADPTSTSLFLSVLDSSLAGSPGAHGPETYASAALAPLPTGTHPRSALTLGYTQTLRRLELDPAGRSPSHFTVGYEAVFVLDGALELRVGAMSSRLSAGAGQVVAPRQLIQFVNVTTAPARALLLFVTPGGEPFEIDMPS